MVVLLGIERINISKPMMSWMQAKILAHFDPKTEVIVTTDPLAVALEACMSIVHKDEERLGFSCFVAYRKELLSIGT